MCGGGFSELAGMLFLIGDTGGYPEVSILVCALACSGYGVCGGIP